MNRQTRAVVTSKAWREHNVPFKKCVNSSELRKASGRKPFRAPSVKEHPFVAARERMVARMPKR